MLIKQDKIGEFSTCGDRQSVSSQDRTRTSILKRKWSRNIAKVSDHSHDRHAKDPVNRRKSHRIPPGDVACLVSERSCECHTYIRIQVNDSCKQREVRPCIVVTVGKNLAIISSRGMLNIARGISAQKLTKHIAPNSHDPRHFAPRTNSA